MVVATTPKPELELTPAPEPSKVQRSRNGHPKAKSKAVKIPAAAHAHLAELAADQERPMGDLVADLIEKERRRAFWQETNAAYARLRADPVAWADWRAEIKSMEGTLMDGLDEYPWEE